MTESYKKKMLDFEMDEFPQPEFIPLKYPVLLCHGFGAVVSMILPSPLHHVSMLLRSHGVTAFAPNIAPYVSLETGSAAWAKVIGKVIRMTGSPKLNIIAHSMGGLSLRHAIHTMKLNDVVASLTTVATPHHGTSLAEMALESPKAALGPLIKLGDAVGNAVYPHIESDVTAALQQLTRSYMKEFNREITDLPGVSYYSVSAASGKNTDSKIGLIFMPYNRYIYAREGVNDGFVSEKSARWGQLTGHTELSHLEQLKLMLSKNQLKPWEDLWLNIIKHLTEDGH